MGVILQGRKLGSDILIAQAEDSMSYDTLLSVRLPDAMLAMSGMKASFVPGQKIHKDLSLSRLEVVVKSMSNALWKSWVVEVTLI